MSWGGQSSLRPYIIKSVCDNTYVLEAFEVTQTTANQAIPNLREFDFATSNMLL